MASTTPKMLLRMWDQLSDLFSHDQLTDNWSKIDFHDHTPGRGVQIPTEGIFDGAITSAKLAPTLDPGPLYTTYRMIGRSSGIIGASAAAGTYALGPSVPTTILWTNVNASYHSFYIDPADYTVSGRTTSFRLRGWGMQTTTTASTQGCTFQLIQVGSLVSGTGFGTPTVVGSVVLAAPSLNTMPVAIGTDFTIPAAGQYIMAAATAGSTAAASSMTLGLDLHVRQV